MKRERGRSKLHAQREKFAVGVAISVVLQAFYLGLRFDLAQLWHLLKQARLLVCQDTGIKRMGRVVNVPTVPLFGPGSATFFGAGEFWKLSPYRAITVDNFPCRDQIMLFKSEIPWMAHCSRGPDECGNNL